MHLLSIIFSTLYSIVLTCDTIPIKIHIEIEGQNVNVIGLQPPNEGLFDTTMFNNFPTIKGGKIFDFKYQLKQSSFLFIVINNELYIPYVLSPKVYIPIEKCTTFRLKSVPLYSRLTRLFAGKERDTNHAKSGDKSPGHIAFLQGRLKFSTNSQKIKGTPRYR